MKWWKKKKEKKKELQLQREVASRQTIFYVFIFLEQSFKTTVWLEKKKPPPQKKAELALCLQPPVSFLMLCRTLHAPAEGGQTEGRSRTSKRPDGGVSSLTLKGCSFPLWHHEGPGLQSCVIGHVFWSTEERRAKGKVTVDHFWEDSLNDSDNQQKSESTVCLFEKKKRKRKETHATHH